MTSIIRHTISSEPHKAFNPTYLLRTTPVILVQPSRSTSLLLFLLEDQRMEKICQLVGLVNAFLTDNREGHNGLIPFLPISTATSRRSDGMKSLSCHFTTASHTVVETFQPITRYAFFPLFFCLSHEITFVQPYIGFVCRRDQGPWGCLYKLSVVMTLRRQPVLLNNAPRGAWGKAATPAIYGMRRTSQTPQFMLMRLLSRSPSGRSTRHHQISGRLLQVQVTHPVLQEANTK